jgi:hypothetical protein
MLRTDGGRGDGRFEQPSEQATDLRALPGMFLTRALFSSAMTTTLLGTLVLPALLGVGLFGFALRRSATRGFRRDPAIAPGRVVIGTTLVSSRRKFR